MQQESRARIYRGLFVDDESERHYLFRANLAPRLQWTTEFNYSRGNDPDFEYPDTPVEWGNGDCYDVRSLYEYLNNWYDVVVMDLNLENFGGLDGGYQIIEAIAAHYNRAQRKLPYLIIISRYLRDSAEQGINISKKWPVRRGAVLFTDHNADEANWDRLYEEILEAFPNSDAAVTPAYHILIQHPEGHDPRERFTMKKLTITISDGTAWSKTFNLENGLESIMLQYLAQKQMVCFRVDDEHKVINPLCVKHKVYESEDSQAVKKFGKHDLSVNITQFNNKAGKRQVIENVGRGVWRLNATVEFTT